MNVLIGDVEKARAMTTELRILGARTPLEFNDLAEAGQMLVAFGEAAESVPATLTKIGDVSQGVGARIQEIAELYGKARVQGTLYAEDINQLVGRGIPVIQEFARILGVPEGQVKKLASEGKITFPMLEVAFANLTKEGGKFGGMMDQLSKEADGLWATTKDEVGGLMRELGKPFQFGWKKSLESTIPILSRIRRELRIIAGDSSVFTEEAGANKPAAADDSEAAAAKIKADYEAQIAAEKDAAQRKLDAKASEERDKQRKHVGELRRETESIAEAMLPDDARLAALAAKLRQLIVESQISSGQSISGDGVEGLKALAKKQREAGDLKGEEGTLTRLKEALRIQKEMEGIEKAKAGAERKDDKQDARVAEARKLFELETKLAGAVAESGDEESAKAKAFQDEINTLRLSSEIQERLQIGQAEALDLARQKVALERQSRDAIDEQAKSMEKLKQLRARQELGAELKVDALKAAGRTKEAADLERKIKIAREAKSIEESTGLGAAQALALAKQKADLEDKAAKRGSSERPDGRQRTQGYSYRRQGGMAAADERRDGIQRAVAEKRKGAYDASFEGLKGFYGRPGNSFGNFSNDLPTPMAGKSEENAAKKDRSEKPTTPMAAVEKLLNTLIETTKKLGGTPG